MKILQITMLVGTMALACALAANAAETPQMVRVAAGWFEMGDSFAEGDESELPVHDVYIDSYFIGIYEVTNAEYCEYLNSAYGLGLIEVINGVVYKDGDDEILCDTDSYDEESQIVFDNGLFFVEADKDDFPMLEVSWFGSVTYSNWLSEQLGATPVYDLETWTMDRSLDGYRLPTEAEWEKAAGWDPVQQRHFRFSEHTDGCGFDCLDAQRANYAASGDPWESGQFPETSPIGYYDGSDHGGTFQTQDARSYYGAYDMSGNVAEWVYDWYGYTYYQSSPQNNPTGPATGTYKSFRGGFWAETPRYLRSTERGGNTPPATSHNWGFRVVRSDLAVGTPGETSPVGNPMTVTGYDDLTGEVTVTYHVPCSATDHTVYLGDLADVASMTFSDQVCFLGIGGSATFDPGLGDRFWVIVANDGSIEGSYGTDGAGSERTGASGLPSCSYSQDLANRCD